MEDYNLLEEGDELELDAVLSSLESGSFSLIDRTKGITIPLKLFASEAQKRMLIAGGRLNEIKEAL